MTERVGLDTNVLMRWLFVEDQPSDQSEAATSAMLNNDTEIWINSIVLAELIWLAAQKLKLGRAEQVQMIRKLLVHPHVAIADRSAVEQALTAFELGGAGLIDHLIGALNIAAGCRSTLTFDKAAAKSPHFTQLS